MLTPWLWSLVWGATGSIPVQGAVDAGGAALEGAHAVRFVLSTDAAGAQIRHDEATSVTFAGGSFSAALQVDLALFRDEPSLYLSVSVDGSELSTPAPVGWAPRAGFAAHAGDADTVGGLDPASLLTTVSGYTRAEVDGLLTGLPWASLDPADLPPHVADGYTRDEVDAALAAVADQAASALLPDEAASVACDAGRLGAVRYNAANDEFEGCFANDGAPQWAAIGAAAAPAPAPCAHGNATLSHTGGPQSFIVPTGCTALTVRLWGAGGGSGYDSAGVYRFGGAGGFTRATVTVTPGETLTIVVGGAGVRNTTVSALGAAAYGGGGAPRSGSVLCAVGGGGGYTGVFRGAPAQGTALAIAGGGGGASGYSHGGNGNDVANSGGASALAGANGSGDWVGGGGGGYVGGSLHTRSTSNATWPSGNGGRGFTASGAVYDVSMLSTPEFSRVPPALSEPGYPGLGSFGAAAVGYGGRGADTGLNCNDAGHGGAYLTW